MIDPKAFFVDWSQIASEDYLHVVYHFVPEGDPRVAAAHVCAESSTAMWQRIGIREDLRDWHGAKVVALTPRAGQPSSYRLEIAHPHRNFGPRLPNLLAAVAGEGAFYAPHIRTIKLIDIQFPESFLRCFEGPRFGLAGLRERWQIFDRPFFVGVVKPNLGLAPADFAALAQAAWEGGLDICKDDEMQADTAWSPLVERVRCVRAVREQAEAATNARKIFIANVSDEVEVMPRLVTAVEAAGADVVMCNPICTGISAVRAIRSVARVPIMGHFAGVAVLSRTPDFGISSACLTKLMRLAGCDLVGIAGFGPRMQTTPEEVRENINACLEPMGMIKPALPIPGGGEWAGTLQRVYAAIGHADFGFIAGRGVFDHPNGPRAGAMSLRQAWEAVRQDRPLTDAARHAPELAAALRAFGN